jgi:hypothetical protein
MCRLFIILVVVAGILANTPGRISTYERDGEYKCSITEPGLPPAIAARQSAQPNDFVRLAVTEIGAFLVALLEISVTPSSERHAVFAPPCCSLQRQHVRMQV